MKYIVETKELRNLIKIAVNKLCNPVLSTLGPTGNNVIINKSLSPFITNDGVTISNSINLNNKKINTIIEIIKESAFNTNEKVGDGTTTTLLITKSIILNGLSLINNGKNAIILKRELDECKDEIIKLLNNYKTKSNKKNLINIATVASSDDEIGKYITNIFLKVKNSFSIILHESNLEKTYYTHKKGYIINIIENKFKKKIMLKETYIIIKEELNDFNDFSEIMNDCLVNNKNLIIFASNVSENIKNEIYYYNLKDNKSIFLFDIEEYGERKKEIINDIKYISNYKNYGIINKIYINNNELLLINNKKCNKIINILYNKLKTNITDYEKEFIKKRISYFDNGIIELYVGGKSKIEIREKIMRYEDALRALDVAKYGIVLGEGVTFLKISNNLSKNTDGYKIMKKVLKDPFKTIIKNLGKDYKKYINEVIKSNYTKIYNYKNNKLEKNFNVIDPVEVLKEIIKNSVSVSSMLLTSSYMVINEDDNNKIEL